MSVSEPVVSSGTVCASEVARFSALSEKWWDPKGEMAVLHAFNPARLAYIRERACEHFRRDGRILRPLEGLRLLDIGCGGGLLCEPMAKLGACVVGVDPSSANIAVAKRHAALGGVSVEYRCSVAEDLAALGERFDIILNMEVVEHVGDVSLFLKSCSDMLRPGGLMIIATINRTLKAFLFAVVGAEYILGWLPRGCHDWNKFVTPEEIRGYLSEHGLVSAFLRGIIYDPFTGGWRPSEDIDVNYVLSATHA